MADGTDHHLVMISEAARHYGISADTCRRKFDAGELVGRRSARGYRMVDLVEESHLLPFVAVTEAAHQLGCSEACVRIWFDSGRLRGHRTPAGHRRIETNHIAEITAGAS